MIFVHHVIFRFTRRENQFEICLICLTVLSAVFLCVFIAYLPILQTDTNLSIFRIQSAVGHLFREFLHSKNFLEIHTAKLQGAATESGASVFKVSYFDRTWNLACLWDCLFLIVVTSSCMRHARRKEGEVTTDNRERHW